MEGKEYDNKVQNKIRSVSIFVLSIMYSCLCFSQTYPKYEKDEKKEWDKKEWCRANTARFAFYMSKQTRESIRFMNLARINGKKFAELYILPIEDKTGYEIGLIRTLEKQKEKPLLKPSFGLHCSSLTHAIWSGLTGYCGHRGIRSRIATFKPLSFGKMYGENCAYGTKKGLYISLDLLIDRGVPSLGHRYNILNNLFFRVGGGSFYHTGYGWNAVYNYMSPNSTDMLFRVKPEIQQYGLNIGVSQISDKPMLDLGFAYLLNHLETSTMLFSLNYNKSLFDKKSNSISLNIASGSNIMTYTNFMGGLKIQNYTSTPFKNLYIQPEISWFTLISLFRNGFMYETNDREKSALYKISYGYNIKIFDNRETNLYHHNITVSRFICIVHKTRK